MARGKRVCGGGSREEGAGRREKAGRRARGGVKDKWKKDQRTGIREQKAGRLVDGQGRKGQVSKNMEWGEGMREEGRRRRDEGKGRREEGRVKEVL